MQIIDMHLNEEDSNDCTVEIFAELTRKQYGLVQSDMVSIEVPHGVSMLNKTGSRALRFTCPNKFTAKELEEGLDARAISWQESYVEDEKVIN